MSKYFYIEDGESHDWKFVKSSKIGTLYFFYTGDIYIGMIFKDKERSYSAISSSDYHIGIPIYGFRSRHDAALHLLNWRDHQKRKMANTTRTTRIVGDQLHIFTTTKTTTTKTTKPIS